MYCYKNGFLLDGSVSSSPVEFTNLDGKAEALRVQASYSSGTLEYAVQVKMHESMDYSTVAGVNVGDFSVVANTDLISDKGIYEFDITGAESVKITTSSTIGSTMKIYGTIFGS